MTTRFVEMDEEDYYKLRDLSEEISQLLENDLEVGIDGELLSDTLEAIDNMIYGYELALTDEEKEDEGE